MYLYRVLLIDPHDANTVGEEEEEDLSNLFLERSADITGQTNSTFQTVTIVLLFLLLFLQTTFPSSLPTRVKSLQTPNQRKKR